MPNHIVNVLRIIASDEKVKEIRKFLVSKADDPDSTFISFNSLIEMPKEYNNNGKWHEWRIEHWGTKWDAYWQEEISDNTISFTTAWSGVPELMSLLSEKYPDVRFEYIFADEDISYNTGRGYFLNGEEHMEYPDGETPEAYEIYFLTRPNDLRFYKKNEDGTYTYIEEEEDVN